MRKSVTRGLLQVPVIPKPRITTQPAPVIPVKSLSLVFSIDPEGSPPGTDVPWETAFCDHSHIVLVNIGYTVIPAGASREGSETAARLHVLMEQSSCAAERRGLSRGA